MASHCARVESALLEVCFGELGVVLLGVLPHPLAVFREHVRRSSAQVEILASGRKGRLDDHGVKDRWWHQGRRILVGRQVWRERQQDPRNNSNAH
jgi:hypothetical protein